MASAHALSSRATYALWAPVYPAEAHNPLMRTEEEAVLPLMASLKPTRALDAGTGSGRYLSAITAAGAATVVGLDFSLDMLRRADPGRLRVCADARRLPFAGERFDLVNASLMAADVGELAPWLTEIASVVTGGGHVLYSDLHASWARFGWRRTFQTPDGRTIDLPFAPHSLDDHLAAVASARLDLLACHEVPLAAGGVEARRFRRRWGAVPVLVVVHAQKPRVTV